MSEDSEDKPEEKPGDQVALGKKFAGEKFVTVRTSDHTREQIELQQKYGEHPEAIPLSMYFSHKLIRDPVRQAMMLAYTKVRKATTAIFDEIFAEF